MTHGGDEVGQTVFAHGAADDFARVGDEEVEAGDGGGGGGGGGGGRGGGGRGKHVKGLEGLGVVRDEDGVVAVAQAVGYVALVLGLEAGAPDGGVVEVVGAGLQEVDGVGVGDAWPGGVHHALPSAAEQELRRLVVRGAGLLAVEELLADFAAVQRRGEASEHVFDEIH